MTIVLIFGQETDNKTHFMRNCAILFATISKIDFQHLIRDYEVALTTPAMVARTT